MDERNDSETVEQRVTTTVAAVFDVDRGTIDRDTEFVGDLHATSLDLVALVGTLQREFEVDVPASDLRDEGTVGATADRIERELEARGDT